MALTNILSNVFKQKPEVCFFCNIEITKEETFTLQYASNEGLHSEKICKECATTLNEMVNTMEELNV